MRKEKSTPVSNFHFHFSTIVLSELTLALQGSKKRTAKSLCVTCMFCHNIHLTIPYSVLLQKKSVKIFDKHKYSQTCHPRLCHFLSSTIPFCKEGDIGVYSIVVLSFSSSGILVNSIFMCSIEVTPSPVVDSFSSLWLTNLICTHLSKTGQCNVQHNFTVSYINQ